MSDIYTELKNLFISNAPLAITKSQDLITSVSGFKTYKEFYSYHIQNPRISTCQKEWSNPQMLIKCYDCGLDPQSCICLECFLNGNHQGHNYLVRPNSVGNCDCGDLSLWKLSGCCKKHQGLNENDHPEDYLDEKLRNTLTDVVFKASFASFPHLQKQTEQKVAPIFQFLSSFLKFGDGFRRLLAISLTERIKFDILLSQIFEYKQFFNILFQQLCGGLTNDQLFKINFALSNYKLLIKRTIPDIFTRIYTQTRTTNYSAWSCFWFHSFTPQTIKTAIEQNNWDWVTFVLEYSKYMKTYFNLKNIMIYQIQDESIFSEISVNIKNATSTQPNEQTQLFFDDLFTKVLNCGTYQAKVKNDTIVPVSFYEMHNNEKYYLPIQVFNVFFYPTLESFNGKKNLKFDKLIEELNRSIDISSIFCINHNSFAKENDLFVCKYIDEIDDVSSIEIDKDSSIKVNIENHFKSFHNGGAFFLSMPLFDSLLYLFRLDNLSRIKISRLLSLAKFKKLRIQLGIVALKKLNALLCCHQSLVSKRNFAVFSVLLPSLIIPTQVHLGIPLIFPVIQLLIGIQSEDDQQLNEFSIKEFFAFEMARELGIFDDFTDVDYKDEDVIEKQKSMFFSFLYSAILLNVERTLFNYNLYNFIEEQIISALKQGISSIDKLEKMCSIDEIKGGKSLSDFNSIINKVTKNTKKGNDVSFSLKDGVPWKSISAIVPFNDQKTLLNKEISKNPNSLLKIQDFSDESDYFFNTSNDSNEHQEDASGINIKLKEFLLTPTVLAITYYTLRTSGEKVELNDHLALNILILISKFVEDFECDLIDQSTVINYDSTVIDLISKLKRTLFNFRTDNDRNATITNTLNKQNFKAFLNLKIGSNSRKPKSIIDILISKGEIGKSVLQQLSVDIEIGDDQTAKNSIKEQKKQRAKKLKESIINQYKNAISNFYTNDLESPEEAKQNDKNETEDEVCSICSSTRDDQILSYPIYIYKTKLPFIFDKPPLVTIREGSELPIDEDKLATSSNLKSENPFKYVFGNKKPSQKVEQKKISDEKLIEKRCTEGNNFIIQFSICQHQIHQSCEKHKQFKCPIDRSVKNGFLPCIDKMSPSSICSSEKVDKETIKGPIMDSISGFIDNFTCFFDESSKRKANLFIELAKSIGGLIVTFEMRLRNLPDCLDSNKNRILARNLFLTTWYSYRVLKKSEIESNSIRLTMFQKFILKLIESDEIEGINSNNKNEVFHRILLEFIQKFNELEPDEIRREKEIFLFLRRVYLAKHFLLDINHDQNQAKFIDWDEILSISNLSSKFGVTFSKLNENFEFKPIVFTKLPKEFIRFGIDPFNFPVVETQKCSVYNILDYNTLINKFDDFEENLDSNQEEKEVLSKELTVFNESNPDLSMKFRNKYYPNVLLLIGKNASTVIIVDNYRMATLNPFYLDNFGCTDVGFKRNKPLFLYEEKYIRVMDLIMSGDFSFYIDN